MPVGFNSIGRPAEPIGAARTAGGGPGTQRMLGGGDCGGIGWLSTRPTDAGGVGAVQDGGQVVPEVLVVQVGVRIDEERVHVRP